VAATFTHYITNTLHHLQDECTYTIITDLEAEQENKDLRTSIISWINQHNKVLPDDTQTYLRKKLIKRREDPFGYFYFLYKLHKTPVKTRPVCSDFSSNPHAFGKWIIPMYQTIVQQFPAYLKDTFELKKL
jgi:hypothetical protein